jgi:acetyl-CoA C-acetyltransferase
VPDVVRDHEVPAPPEAVSAVIVDLPRWPEWFALYKGWVEDPPPAAEAGVRFRHRVRILGVPADITWEVVEAEPPRRFAMKGKGSQRTSAAVSFAIAPSGAGSRVRIEAEIGGLVLRPVKGQLRSWLEPRIERTLTALEAEAQARAGRPAG